MKRSWLISLAATVLGCLTGPALCADQDLSDPLQRWIGANAATVRSINSADEDFSDLEPLAKAIGPAQVVALGEPGHGAGTAFAAKVRLIKFLHQQLGFDVLVWESGMYDVELSEAGMRGSDPALTAARRGVFQLWSDTGEVRPLFDYIKASQATAHPLHVAGFDMQVTANGSMEQFASDLRVFVRGLKEPGLENDMAALADRALSARTRLFSTKFATEADLASLDKAAQGLLAGMHDHRAAFEQIHDARSIALMQRWIVNMQMDARQRYEASHSKGPEVARENRRDAHNFENLRWLIQEGYPGHKFIIWAHNVHVMKADYSADFRTINAEPKAGDMKTTGAFLSGWLGKQAYAIGMTAYQGQDALVTGGTATIIPPAPADSLEGRLHALGRSFVFLDLHIAASTLPIRKTLSARMPKYETSVIPDVGRVFDGIFYIDQMQAATKLQ
jgi:erythromycin esterase